MSFLNNLVNEFTHKGQGQQSQGYGQNQGYGQQQQYGGGGGYGQQQSYNNERPNPPAPWIAEWDQRENRWVYINRENGDRTHEFPQGGRGYGGGGGYPQQGYGQQGGYGQQSYNQPPQQKSHAGRNTALGVGAGLVGGALLMHEGEKLDERWDEDKYRMENRFEDDKYRMENSVDNGIQDVEDAPDNVANWMGRKTQEVEDIPDDIEGRWDADTAGIRNAYDDGRDQQEYRDEQNNDW